MDEYDVPSHIVGIGASAGRLEALQMFLQFLPNDTNASFVIVQHLSPDFKGLLVERLAQQTNMPVLNATDAIEVKANTIYVIPPKKSMLIAEGKLLHSDRPSDIDHHFPIDIFFRSLAEDQQHKAIGVVLPGTGSDGSRGVKALKEAGGLVIAQEPTSAKFDGMPVSAVNTGLVDLILPPEQIGPQLSQYFTRKDGFLLMGSSESLGELEPHFSPIGDNRYRLFQKVSNQRIPISYSPINPSDASRQTQSALSPVSGVLRNYRKSAQEQGGFVMPVDLLIGEYVPPCILLNNNFDAIHAYGDISRFVRRLAPGKVSVNVNDMMIEDISIAVSTALHRARQTEQDVFYSGVEYTQDNETKSLDLSVLRVANAKSKTLPQYYWLILQTTDAPPKPKKKNSAVAFDTEEQARQRILDLETELKRNREHLQVTIEELETTNEELQSVNEELFTVNSEYQEKLSEVSSTNADLDDVLKLANIGIIFLDERLSIRRFTPAVAQYIHLVDTDVGRPIHHISAPNGYDNFVQDISDASNNRRSVEKEITLKNERVILVKIVPHESPADHIQNAVTITFNDITAIKTGKRSSTTTEVKKQLTDALIAFEHLPPPHKLYVLVVDDDEDSRYILASNLQSSDFCQYSITVANSAAQACEMIQKTDFDICITDFRLGDDTAIELFTQTQILDNQPPFVVVTNYPEDTLYAKLLSAGITDLISKAEITPEVISRAVRYAVQKRSLVKTLTQQIGD